MAAFIVIGCPWLLVAIFLMWMQRRAEDPTTGQWRSEPSNFFGGPVTDEPSAAATQAPETATKPGVH